MSAAPSPSDDTRRGARRPSGPRTGEESWFGAFEGDEESRLGDDPSDAGADSRYEAGLSAAARPPDSRFLSRRARRLATGESQTAFDRIYRVFLGARVALGFALVIASLLAGLLGTLPSYNAMLVSAIYAALTLSMWLLPRFRRRARPRELAQLRSPQWIATIGTDIVCFTALHLVARAGTFNYVALLALPVLMAGVLTPRRQALATVAGVALILLATVWVMGAPGSAEFTAALTQAGLAGSGLFVITVLAGELAGRLAREELTAKGSLELARQQAQLNRLVIEEMQDGVLVVDRRGRVRAANPSARRLLAPRGMARPAPFQLRGIDAWEALVKTVERGFGEGVWPEAGRDVPLVFESGETRTLRVRIRFTRSEQAQSREDFCVLLLEDVRNMQARMRQEQLAAMGRVSAGIAHEIRNPLAAIAQANALLSEDATTPAQRQLTRMVNENVERLKRLVDDVMEVAPGVSPEAGVIDVSAHLATIGSDWARAAQLTIDGHSALRVDLPTEPLGGVFDAEHLRRVMVNLLDNGYRHASKSPGSVHLRLAAPDATQLLIIVASDGPPIPPDVERHLFEPFFSTRSRGTGLGLYICRELCERYGASIEYRLRAQDQANRNEFRVTLRRQALANTEARLPLSG